MLGHTSNMVSHVNPMKKLETVEIKCNLLNWLNPN